MIVVCTNCQAKFRVADEKIGPRGAKVRCSRCRNVFVVHPEIGSLGEGTKGAGAGAPAAGAEAAGHENPFVSNPVRALGTPPPSALPPPLPGAGPEPAGLPASPALADAPPARADDPFAGAPPPDPFAPPPPDASAPEPDPFSLVGAPGEGGGGSLPLTDLSDLLRAAVPPAEAPPPEPPAAPPPAAEPPAAEPPFAEPDEGGLALEERLTPPPVRVGGPPRFGEMDLAAPPPPADPFAGPGGHAFDAASFDGEPLPGAEALELANEPAKAPAAAPPAPAEAPAEAAPAQPAAAAPEPAPEGDERIPRRASRSRSIAVNAIALAALLAVALAFLVVWRSEGPIEAVSLRPSAIVTALRSGRSAGPFSAADLRSGEYEREEGPPVLFVRGKAVSRAPGPVRGLRVSVEIVRDGQVVARGEALAGAVPTPEELWRARDAEALADLARTASARAPRNVAPGDQVPFLVAIGERPADLEGASLRVEVSPAGSRGP